MRRAVLCGLASALVATGASPPRYDAPPENAQLAPGPDVALAQAHCLVCHSADYITTQPRGFAQPTVFWTAEVNKMKKAYGARLTDDESARIVAYLTAAYGK